MGLICGREAKALTAAPNTVSGLENEFSFEREGRVRYSFFEPPILFEEPAAQITAAIGAPVVMFCYEKELPLFQARKDHVLHLFFWFAERTGNFVFKELQG